ncbi:MAG: DUF2939 domain-containing protein [Rhodospirillales bacterium]|nr:DUF2939 domain-containing protein [Alphaproteobacteria bacterium]MCB9986896.1 DUF2939 domain-containing protein [Rhodospirillales bacterium]USO08326.1 MAG: DUF2939 domain-containing protein [Rhodospirillales bacterium]
MLKTIIALTVLVALALFLSPYYTVTRLAAALEDENPKAVATYVDVQAVQAYLQRDLAARGQAEGGGLGKMIGNLAGAAAGSLVTPDTMVAVLKDRQPREALGISDSWKRVLRDGHWISTDQFVLTSPEGKPAALLTRHGVNWQVTGIRL